MLKKSILIFSVILIALSIIACSGNDSDNTEAPLTNADITGAHSNETEASVTVQETKAAVTTLPAVTEAPQKVLIDGETTDYKIVYPDNGSGKFKNYLSDLKLRIELATGVKLESSIDTKTEESKFEILFGDTNRKETREAKAMIGDKDYIVAIIEDKLVLYAKDDFSYSFLNKYVTSEYIKGSKLSVPEGLSYTAAVYTNILSDKTVSSNKILETSFTLSDNQSNVSFVIGKPNDSSYEGVKGYRVNITKTKVTFSRQMGSLGQMATKNVNLKSGKEYKVIFEFDGDYCRFYLVDDVEGVEPWPEFELSVGMINDYSIYLKESSGYGAEFGEVTVTDYVGEGEGLKYKNAILQDGADPEVFYYDGTYYLYVTSSGYVVYTSTDTVNWTKHGKTIPNGGWGVNANYWAPDVEYINGKFYMAVSFGEDGFGFAVADSPLGPFVCQGSEPLLKRTIDGHIFVDDDGKMYLYYTSWYNGRTYGIYGVEIAFEGELLLPKWETEKLLITATEDWERDQGAVVEGPYMLKHNGTYYLVYSGSHYQSPLYAVGYATSNKPISGFKKYKQSPILVGNSEVHGTGHCSFAPAPDGETLLIFYHAHLNIETIHPRKTCVDAIRFVPTESGIDKLEVYGPSVKRHNAWWTNVN